MIAFERHMHARAISLSLALLFCPSFSVLSSTSRFVAQLSHPLVVCRATARLYRLHHESDSAERSQTKGQILGTESCLRPLSNTL